MPLGAVAVDLGASGARFASGECVEGRLRWRIVEAIAHAPMREAGREVWDVDALLALCRRAVAYGAARYRRSAVGIDAWGVDHGFLDAGGRLLQAPVCYRDASHGRQFERLAEHRSRLFAATGVAHQPFNTVYQLSARHAERPELAAPGVRWALLPDLLGELLGGGRFCELTEASTTQLLGLDGAWSPEAFALTGFPMPCGPPERPGGLGGELAETVSLARVASHDTASAIDGLGELPASAMYLNLGTWSLGGVLLDAPLASPEVEASGFTNERAGDGRVRFLKNMAGFWVLNRLHAELGAATTVGEWLEAAAAVDERVDLMDASLYNPSSMLEAVGRLAGWSSASAEAWAGLALTSLASTIAAQVPDLRRLTGRKIDRIRVGGGGSRSERLRGELASASGCEVEVGPSEATVVGNLSACLAALGAPVAPGSGSPA